MSEINMTPLVDVMLVLVVILLITAPLLGSAIKIDLPRGAGGRSAAAPGFVALAIDRAGQLYFNDRPVDAVALGAALALAAQRDPDTEVHLHADTTVAYGRVVEVMGLAQKSGLNRLAFVARAEIAPAAAAYP